MRVGIYGRCSTRDKQEAENQLLQLRAFAIRQQWEVVLEFVDLESGKPASRPAFQRMFNAASKREFDLLLFWDLSRLTREGTLPTLKHLERLASYGVQWRSFSEPYFDSCGVFRDCVISIMATLARQERIKIRERVLAGLERHKRDAASGKVSSRSRKNLGIGRPD
jgi:DNA invertase Pin-like site-specific DNA recombinase